MQSSTVVARDVVAGNSLDGVLVELGEFGRYQLLTFALFAVAVTLHSMAHVAFVFTAKDVDYRCRVPSCDTPANVYDEWWVANAIPFVGGRPAKCMRFEEEEHAPSVNASQCDANVFRRGVLQHACDDGYVYATSEVTVLHAFDLHCNSNVWKLTLIGTVNNVGQFVGLPLSGLVSDRYGRRTVLVWGLVLCALAAIVRAFSVDYVMFLAFELLDAAFGAGVYACGFLLSVELVGPSKRVLVGAVISSCYAVGEVLVALIAWQLQHWRAIIVACYAPALLTITYLWITPESVRWLLTQRRIGEATAVLRRLARFNGRSISDATLAALCQETTSQQTAGHCDASLTAVLRSRTLRLRFFNCCFCWITCALLFYGLTLNSVTLAAGNSYVDFILTSLVEIPAYVATCFIVDRFGRRLSQSAAFLVTGISCFVFVFADDNTYHLQLLVYLSGKFGATMAFTIIYIITSEVFPTPLRHSMMGVCSMVGRLGSMSAPQMPLLEQLWKPLPLLLFGIVSTLAGVTSLCFPETYNLKLPDTIEEASNIGKRAKDVEPSSLL